MVGVAHHTHSNLYATISTHARSSSRWIWMPGFNTISHPNVMRGETRKARHRNPLNTQRRRTTRRQNTRRRATQATKMIPHLYASGIPSLEMVLRKKITTIIDLTGRGEPNRIRDAYRANHITYIHSPIRNGSPPTSRQMSHLKRIISGCIEGGDCLVHCCGGHGRTGTVIASYLVGMGRVDGDEAIRFVRSKRRRSVETVGQEQFVRSY